MAKLKVQGNASGTGVVTLTAPNTNTDRTITLPDEDITLGGGVDGIVSSANATAITIDSSENVGIGTSSPSNPLSVQSNSNAEAIRVLGRSSDDIGAIDFYENDNTTQLANIQVRQDNLQIRSRTGYIRFDTNGTNERMRIDSSGKALIGETSLGGATDARLHVWGNSANYCQAFKAPSLYAGSYRMALFAVTSSHTTVGTITSNGSSTSYNTTSDYRLKENVEPMTGSIDRLKQLKPSRFNFIADADKTVDGFLAHEAQEVVPEAVSGEKDAMRTEEYEVEPAVEATYDDDGNELTPAVEAVMGTRSVPDYQGIDQSKLVPLLVSALQEAIARIEQLENV